MNLPVLHINNVVAVRFVENHRRTEHIHKEDFFHSQAVAEDRLANKKVTSGFQVADIIITPLAASRLI